MPLHKAARGAVPHGGGTASSCVGSRTKELPNSPPRARAGASSDPHLEAAPHMRGRDPRGQCPNAPVRQQRRQEAGESETLNPSRNSQVSLVVPVYSPLRPLMSCSIRGE